MAIPFFDLSAAHAEIRPQLDAAWARVVDSGRFVLGPELEAFECELAAMCGAADAVGVGCGLDALVLTLRALGIGPGDEVIVPGHTFIATWLAVTHTGATPVPADVERATGNLDPATAEAAIGPRTRAIIAVHLYGCPADVEALRRLAGLHDLLLIEDAAQAHGATYEGRPVGSLGDAAAFSFYPGKNLGALGDGGAVVTGDRDLARRVRLLRDYGSPVKHEHELQGFNSRLDELQAAVLRVKLALLGEWNERRRRAAERYLNELAGVKRLTLPIVPIGAEPVWHQFVVRHPERDRLQADLAARGVSTQIHYPIPPHRTGAYAGLDAALPISEAFAAEALSLPIGPHLTPDDQQQVIEALGEVA